MNLRALTIDDVATGLGYRKPVHHRGRVCGVLVDITPPLEIQQETEPEFWRRKAAERAKALHAAEGRIRVLEARIRELEDEVAEA